MQTVKEKICNISNAVLGSVEYQVYTIRDEYLSSVVNVLYFDYSK